MSRGSVLVGVLAVVGLFVATAGLWPWDHDEVHGLMELGRVPLDQYPGPAAQLARMHRLVPVWYVMQNAALSVLPQNEWGTRMLPASCGALVVIIAFLVARRARGGWFAWSLFALMAGSQTLIWLSQQNRFYSLALLWTTLAIVFMWVPDSRPRFDVFAAVAATAAVLTHNLTLVVFVLGAAAAIAVRLLKPIAMPATAARRAIVAAAPPVAIYLMYLRPLLTGWVSGNTGGSSPLISFVAQTGVAPFGMAILGAAAVVRDPRARPLVWWVVLLVLSVAFVASAPWTIGNWNPRYGLFFMPPVWVLAAMGSAVIAEALAANGLSGWWLAALVVLLLPKLASHFIDGSRHDFRTAAQAIAAGAPLDQVLSNWPAELQYYLEPMTGQRARYWSPGDPLPAAETVVAIGSNAWEPSLRVTGRSVRVIGQVGRRRFDEQSHVVMIYLVSARQP